jgi:hypothetical protein
MKYESLSPLETGVMEWSISAGRNTFLAVAQMVATAEGAGM